MADLSPAECLAAMLSASGVFEDYGDALAAALRVLADQVVPETAARTDRAANRRKIRAQILAIAAKLEGK